MSTVQKIRASLDKFMVAGRGPQPKDVYRAAQWEMAGAHLFLMNGLLSTYEKATNIPEGKVQPFCEYGLQWVAAIEHHHDWEEKEYFTQYPSTFNMNDILTEHEAFHAGVISMRDYLVSCLPAGATWGYGYTAGPHEQQQYDGARLQAIIDGFADTLTSHLMKEIDYLEPDKIRATGLTEDQMKVIAASVETHMKGMSPFTFLMYTILHIPKGCGFPPIPGFVKNILAPYVFYFPNRRMWQFAPKN